MNEPVIQSASDSVAVPSGLVERAITDIRALIRDAGLKAGDVLPSETAISERLGVSRAVTREAFRALSALRILEIGNGRRARVAAPDAAALSMIIDHTVYTKQLSIQQVLDVRRTLELRTASLAALRRSDAEARMLQDTVAQMFASLEDPGKLMGLDIHFHEVIARASGNSLYAILVGSFRVITEQTWHIGWRSRGSLANRTENIRCHERIATAIAVQDPVRAETMMAEHFDSAMTVLLSAGVT
ncbi:GntR family transcriptional regulator [Frigidibacter albus]|uniref:FadR/GntR family transcriptional regulator n=1 Tax=Frigidibacter albus TaxID=1465486 RepID=UPI00136EE8CA|nr:FadR/GntR family transcriptional regulator [Frigidibacter albus]GGH43690.1 GntR family transcriptional regulator [Frigidibacter albus]